MQMSSGLSTLALAGCGSNSVPFLDVKNLSDEAAFKAYIKTIGTLDTADIYIWFKGVLWGVIPGRLPMALCGFQGLARHRWTAKSDGSHVQKAYDVGFFSHLETGLPTDFIVNPITGEKVETYHNKYGGFEQVHTLDKFTGQSTDGNGKLTELDWNIAGSQVTLTERSSGQVKSKMQPSEWPRESSGPINFYGGETSYAMSLRNLSDPKLNSVDYDLFWSSFSPWEPWLLMDGAAGICQWRATGMKLEDYSEAPRDMLDFVRQDQPNYFEPEDPWDGYLSNTDRYVKDRPPMPTHK